MARAFTTRYLLLESPRLGNKTSSAGSTFTQALEAVLIPSVTVAITTTYVALYVLTGHDSYERDPSNKAVMESYGCTAAFAVMYVKVVFVIWADRWSVPRITRVGCWDGKN